MTTLEQLGPLPPITVELNLFDYVPLDSPREPPPVELRARLARSYDTAADGAGASFVTGPRTHGSGDGVVPASPIAVLAS